MGGQVPCGVHERSPRWEFGGKHPKTGIWGQKSPKAGQVRLFAVTAAVASNVGQTTDSEGGLKAIARSAVTLNSPLTVKLKGC